MHHRTTSIKKKASKNLPEATPSGIIGTKTLMFKLEEARSQR
jgi:hypothetical protein